MELFLPDANTGEGLSNLDYACIAVELGKSPMASQCMNCSAPDTGNMDVLEHVGTPEQKAKWLKPLLDGEIRSACAVTEVYHASSDARNIATTAVLDGDQSVINGEKHHISGASNARCAWPTGLTKCTPGGGAAGNRIAQKKPGHGQGIQEGQGRATGLRFSVSAAPAARGRWPAAPGL